MRLLAIMVLVMISSMSFAQLAQPNGPRLDTTYYEDDVNHLISLSTYEGRILVTSAVDINKIEVYYYDTKEMIQSLPDIDTNEVLIFVEAKKQLYIRIHTAKTCIRYIIPPI